MYSRYNYDGETCVNGFLFVSNAKNDDALAKIIEQAKKECWKHNISLEMVGIEHERETMQLEREAIVSLIADLGLGKYDAFIVGENIRRLRKQKGITIEQLSEQLDRSVTHVNLIELGNRKLTMSMLFQIMDYFKVDANDVLGIPEKENTVNSIEQELESMPIEHGNYLRNMFLEMIHSFPQTMVS